MLPDPHKACSLYHALLILNGTINPGTIQGNAELLGQLIIHKSIQRVYASVFPPPNILTYQTAKHGPPGLDALVDAYRRLPFAFRAVTINDAHYPPALRRVHGAPSYLYCRGDTSLASRDTIVIIGTHPLHDPTAINQARSLIQHLAASGYVIVSTITSGCNSFVHRTAMEYDGKTVGVLASPLNQLRPDDDTELSDTLSREHALVSPFPIGIEIQPSFLDQCILTMVGLSTCGVIVFNSHHDPGAFARAIDTCISQRKPLYALPRSIDAGHAWTKTYKRYIRIPTEETLP